MPTGGRPDLPIGVVIVDDRRLARIAAKAIIEESRDLVWLGEAASAEEALSLVPRVGPRVVLLDVEMPGIDGAETARRLKALVPDLVILAWTVSDEGDDLLRMLAYYRRCVDPDAHLVPLEPRALGLFEPQHIGSAPLPATDRLHLLLLAIGLSLAPTISQNDRERSVDRRSTPALNCCQV